MDSQKLILRFFLAFALLVIQPFQAAANNPKDSPDESHVTESEPIRIMAQQDAKSEEEGVDEVLEGFEETESTGEQIDELDEVLEGFEEEKADAPTSTAPEKEKEPPYWDLGGSLTLGSSISISHDAPDPGEPDFRGITRLRPDLHLDLDITLSDNWKSLIGGRAFYDAAYQIMGRDEFTDEALDVHETEAEFWEFYVQGPLISEVDLKLGRQIVVWGRADNIRVVDFINPLDIREPGLVDIEDLRLPITMTKLDYYVGSWNLSGIAIHEMRFDKSPVFGSEFFPFDTPLPVEKEPANTLENTEFGLALNGIFSGWDVSFYGARFFDDQPHVEQATATQLERRHSRLKMAGAAANIALGNWLLRWEAAYIDGLEFFAKPGDDRSRFDLLVGLEYSGFTDTTIALETVNRRIMDFDDALKASPDNAQKDEFQALLRYSADFLNDRFHLVFLASLFGLTGDDGAFQRISGEYDLTDDVSIKAGLVTYQSGDKASFRQIGDNDRIFLEAKYSF